MQKSHIRLDRAKHFMAIKKTNKKTTTFLSFLDSRSSEVFLVWFSIKYLITFIFIIIIHTMGTGISSYLHTIACFFLFFVSLTRLFEVFQSQYVRDSTYSFIFVCSLLLGWLFYFKS